jgi:uncharacterized protein (TIGR03382 family)
MNNTILLVVAALAVLWLLMRRKPVAAAAYQGAYTGASAAGLGSLAGWGSLLGGVAQGLRTPPQPYAAVGVSSSGTAGLGDAPPITDEELLGLLG